MRIVVDANIVISIMTKLDGASARTWLEADTDIVFTAPDHLRNELAKHRTRIAKLMKRSVADVAELEGLLLERVEFHAAHGVPERYLTKAKELTGDVDPKDAPYVALALFFDCQIWSGDRRLSKGLSKKDARMVLDNITVRYLIEQHRRGPQ